MQPSSMKQMVSFDTIPFEIIVEIAEQSVKVWYLLSITLSEFGRYSIKENVKNRAKRMFVEPPKLEPIERILYVPLQMYRMFDQRCALPLVSLQFHSIELLAKIDK
jgi:hypothetical protein